MSLTLLEMKPIYPVSLEEAKHFLRSTLDDTMENWATMEAIGAAAMQAESVTGRCILNSNWEYVPEQVGAFYELPLVPVTKVEIFDTSVSPELKVPERAYKFSASSVYPKGSPIRATVQVLPHELNADPSIDPEGNINSGSIKMILSCGFNIKVTDGAEINPKTPPIVKSVNLLDDNNVSFTFDRPINEVICLDLSKPVIKVFDATTDTETSYVVSNIKVDSSGIVIVTAEDPIILDGVTPVIIKAIFYDTLISDKYMNIFDINSDASGTVLTWTDPVMPDPFKTEVIEELECPDPIKRWVLVRVGTFHQQRTDIALRSGTANNSMFSRNFIDCLLDPYVVERFV